MQAGPSSEGRSTRPRKPKGAYADDEATAQAFLAEQDAAAVEPKTAAKAVRKSTKSGGSASKDAERANPAAKVHVCAGVRFMELVRLLPELMTIFDGLDDARFTTALKVPLTSPRGSPKAFAAKRSSGPYLDNEVVTDDGEVVVISASETENKVTVMAPESRGAALGKSTILILFKKHETFRDADVQHDLEECRKALVEILPKYSDWHRPWTDLASGTTFHREQLWAGANGRALTFRLLHRACVALNKFPEGSIEHRRGRCLFAKLGQASITMGRDFIKGMLNLLSEKEDETEEWHNSSA